MKILYFRSVWGLDAMPTLADRFKKIDDETVSCTFLRTDKWIFWNGFKFNPLPGISYWHRFFGMKICRMFPLLLSVICAVLSTGCASTRLTVNTWRNPSFSPTSTNTIALKRNVNARPMDTETGRLLADEMRREGFLLAPEERADYLLSYVVSENVEEHTVAENYTPPAAPPSQTVTQPGLIYSYSSVEKSYFIHVRDIRLFLYTNPRTNPAGLQLAWQGTITIGREKSARDEQAVLGTLLHYFGGEQNGPVDLVR